MSDILKKILDKMKGTGGLVLFDTDVNRPPQITLGLRLWLFRKRVQWALARRLKP